MARYGIILYSKPEKRSTLKTLLSVVSTIFALSLFIPMIRGIVRGELRQSFATWIIWSILDWIAAGSAYMQGGAFILPLTYALAGSTVTVLLVRGKQFSWSWIETMTSVLVVASMVGWYVGGNKTAIVMSATALSIGTIPQMVQFYRQPDRQAGWIYAGFLLANTLSFLSGKSWTIEERFYSGSCVFATLICVYLALRKK